jgi:hypothetical protein
MKASINKTFAIMKQFKILSLLGVLHFLGSAPSNAQVLNTGMVEQMDSTGNEKVTFSGFVDVYYRYDLNEPEGGNIPYFVSSARHAELNINLAYLGMHYRNDRVRARFYPGFGTYMNSNYAAETGSLKYLLEANAGICLSEKRAIWLDAGVLGSPYTNESAISKDHFMYTRSLAPEYVPYYVSGLKLTLPLSEKLNLYTYVLNGWQNINETNETPALGTQLEYRPNAKWLVNFNTYIGNEKSKLSPNSAMRYFGDVYCIYNPDGVFSMTACTYLGFQEFEPAQERYSRWWQAKWIGRIKLGKANFISLRAEYFDDPDGVVVRNITKERAFQASSVGIGYTRTINRNGMIRLEYRHFYSPNNTFINRNGDTNQSIGLTANMSVWF